MYRLVFRCFRAVEWIAAGNLGIIPIDATVGDKQSLYSTREPKTFPINIFYKTKSDSGEMEGMYTEKISIRYTTSIGHYIVAGLFGVLLSLAKDGLPTTSWHQAIALGIGIGILSDEQLITKIKKYKV